ncbi:MULTISPECIES: hypothetical protein [Thermococcus]|uniref:Uncharacterized protein n=2 Tax=Thermococcus sibiricus TaxID=172049 RepID=C6A4P7_THESM|nr:MULTISPECIES: hypothetical protein [Thermococcus]KUK28185.1 MAG: Uncharacterized protein XD61_1279 [Thermococcus sp. 40_45]HII67699.1 hypothetical protein [Thermococcaceae archaeon]ACS90592.1 hypothetical protein TSIB_1541 [Thermococcus sibiricus MM 739]KUK17209.1 MAG: Uncharacterized protein XD54_1487 [Thermococcus sibiricus]MBC7094557.1 hypothetical protein [Thermococcus sp.]
MKLKGIRPSNFGGVPLLIVILAFVFMIGGTELLSWWMLIIGWVLIFASGGISAEIKNDTLILRYGFGLLPIKLKAEDIEEVLVLNRLEKGVLLRYFPGIGAAYMGMLIYVLCRYFTFPGNLLPGYYFGALGMIVISSSVLISLAIPPGKTRHKLLTAGFIFVVSAFLLGFKVRAVDLIPIVVVLGMIALWTVYDMDIQDYIVLKTRKGKYLLTSNAPRNKVEKAIKAVMEALSDD